MNAIPPKLKRELAADPEYKSCALVGHGTCEGRITWEHALTFRGKQIQERWAIIPLCAQHHEVDRFQDAGTMNKEMNVWVALNRATDDELLKVSKVVNYIRLRSYLNGRYGDYRAIPTSN